MMSKVRLLLLVLFLGLCVLVGTERGIADTELIVNSGFETGDLAPGWEDLGLPVPPGISDVHSYSGNYSMTMGYTASGVFQDFSPTATTTGNLTFWLRVPSYPDVEPDTIVSPGGIWVGIGYADGTGHGTDMVDLIESAQWSQFNISVDNSKKIANITITAWDVHPVYFDDFSLHSPQPAIESCGITGEKKDSFDLGAAIYVNGSHYSPSTIFDLYIVNDVETWTNGIPIPPRVSSTASTVSSDSSGNVLPTDAWNNPQTIGKYDILVDVNSNGQYDENIDALDNNDVEVTAGFVVPEFSSLIDLVMFMTAPLLAVLAYNKKRFAQCSRAQLFEKAAF
jgi:hypothetical protein